MSNAFPLGPIVYPVRFEREGRFPFGARIVDATGAEILRADTYAWSTKADTSDEVDRGVGFSPGIERDVAVAANKNHFALYEQLAELLNRNAGPSNV